MRNAYLPDPTPDTRVELDNSEAALPNRSGGLSRKPGTTLLIVIVSLFSKTIQIGAWQRNCAQRIQVVKALEECISERWVQAKGHGLAS